MIRIAISLAAYHAIVSTIPQGRTAPPEPLEVGEGVALWIDYVTLAVLRRERRGGEGWSEVTGWLLISLSHPPLRGTSVGT